ncbi:MAG: class I SAM-dependent methyltransferase [Turneriella sp.]|nr:class I SAM-dependent methyltransferase [Turneriella sp.]
MQDLENRLVRMRKHWAKWARRRGISCYRVYDRDIPEYPYVADIYEDHLILTEMPTPAFEARPNLLEFRQNIRALFCRIFEIPPQKLHEKRRVRRGDGEQHEKLGDADGFIASEAGLKFKIYPDNWLDTGLFLDHRNLRGEVRKLAAGKNVLNLFCYTGSFSVYAAAGGAALVHSVDLSARYLAIVEENFALNGLTETGVIRQNFRADARDFLQTAMADFYDIIVCDAPVFSKSRKQERDFDVLRDHPELIRGCLRALKNDGVLFFSTNFRKFRIRFPEAHDAALVKDISAQTIPEDFRNKWIHACYRVSHAAAVRA